MGYVEIPVSTKLHCKLKSIFRKYGKDLRLIQINGGHQIYQRDQNNFIKFVISFQTEQFLSFCVKF